MLRLLLALLVAAGLVVAVGVWFVPADRLGPQLPEARNTGADAPTTVRLSPPALDAFTSLTRRPPFAANRRAISETTGNDEQLILGRYRLSGVVVAPARRSVILSTTDSGSVVVAEGEKVDGWTVDEITAERVVFVSGVRRQEVSVTPRDR